MKRQRDDDIDLKSAYKKFYHLDQKEMHLDPERLKQKLTHQLDVLIDKCEKYTNGVHKFLDDQDDPFDCGDVVDRIAGETQWDCISGLLYYMEHIYVINWIDQYEPTDGDGTLYQYTIEDHIFSNWPKENEPSDHLNLSCFADNQNRAKRDMILYMIDHKVSNYTYRTSSLLTDSFFSKLNFGFSDRHIETIRSIYKKRCHTTGLFIILSECDRKEITNGFAFATKKTIVNSNWGGWYNYKIKNCDQNIKIL